MTFILRSKENGDLCGGSGLGGVRVGTQALLVVLCFGEQPSVMHMCGAVSCGCVHPL